jgi:plasmid stability protein
MATITLKSIPDDLYERLKLRARAHHRSINGEVIHCLELALLAKRIAPEERLKRIRSARPRIDPRAVSVEDVLAAIDEGRP